MPSFAGASFLLLFDEQARTPFLNTIRKTPRSRREEEARCSDKTASFLVYIIYIISYLHLLVSKTSFHKKDNVWHLQGRESVHEWIVRGQERIRRSIRRLGTFGEGRRHGGRRWRIGIRARNDAICVNVWFVDFNLQKGTLLGERYSKITGVVDGAIATLVGHGVGCALAGSKVKHIGAQDEEIRVVEYVHDLNLKDIHSSKGITFSLNTGDLRPRV